MQVAPANRPRRGVASAIWLAAVAFVGAIALAEPGIAKERNPIAGVLAPERVTAEVGTTLHYRLEVSTTVAFKRVVVRLKVPDGVTMVTGAAQAEIVNFGPGETRVFEYAIRLDTAGAKKVWAEAEVLGLEPAVLRRMFLSEVNPADADKPPPTIVRDRQGNTYQVQSIPFKPSP